MRTRTVLTKIKTRSSLGPIFYAILLYFFCYPTLATNFQGQSSFGGHAAGIIRDVVVQEGAIFLGAENGLIQLTGNTVKIYDKNNSPLGTGYISDLEVDHNGNVWISEYGGGLYFLDPRLGVISRIIVSGHLLKNIWSIKKVKHLLIIGLIGGLIIYDTSTAKIVKKLTSVDEKKIEGSIAIEVIDDTHVAFAERSRLVKINLPTLAVESQAIANNYPKLSRITAITAHKGRLFIGGDEGIYETGLEVDRYRYYANSSSRKRGFDITDIYVDSYGRILVAAGGFYIVDEKNSEIVASKWFNPVLTSSSIETVTAISQTPNGELLLASSQLGLVTVPVLGHALNILNTGKSFFQDNFKGLLTFSEERAGIITDEGIYTLDTATGEVSPITVKSGDGNDTIFNHSQFQCLNKIFRGKEIEKQISGELYALCTAPLSFSIGYLGSTSLIFNQSAGKAHFFVANREGIILDKFIAPKGSMGAYYSSTGELYAFTGSGEIFIQNSKVSWRKLENNPLSGSVITCSVELSKNEVLFCSSGKGMIQFNSTTREFSQSRVLQEVSLKYVRSAMKDKQGNVWIASNKGLFLFHGEQGISEKITSLEGIYDLDFEYHGIKSLGERLLVVGDRYSYLINTATIHSILATQRTRTSSTKITSFEDESGYYGEAASSAKVPISLSAGPISLPFVDNSFTLNVTSTDFVRNEVQKINYRLKGYSEDWSTSDTSQASVNYSSLPVGEYVFQARVVDPRSQADQPITSLRIRVLPPIWLTWQAFVVYSLFLALMLAHFYKKYQQQLALRGSHLSGMVTEKQDALEDSNTSIKRLLQRKQTLFTNVSHELRTPLSLIVGPLEQIKEDPTNPDNKRRIGIVTRNAERLGRLVNQLLEIEQLESIKESPRQEYDIETAVPLIVSNVEPLAEYKHHDFKFRMSGKGSIRLLADSLEQIIGNLVSNAVKYTPEGGAVSVLVRCDDLHLVVEVADTGAGMTEEEIKIIFNRFTRLQKEEETDGAGVGLALIKELIVANGGWISVSSKPGEGSTFTVHLPMFEVESPVMSTLKPTLMQEAFDAEVSDTATIVDADISKPIILIVEDNDEMRAFINEILKNKYSCLTAKDGKEALQTANAVLPSLILTDYMMPRMDGLLFAKAIRDQELTSHIPIILLTARGDSDTRQRSLNTHVDYCLTKPVNKTELILRIENLLELRRRAAESLRDNIDEQNSASDAGAALPEFANEKDQSFYIKFLCTIEKHYADESFSRQLAAKEMAVSERQLNRKLAMLFEHNFAEYLKQYRLQKSKALLRSGRQITQVAYDVGFSSPGYFSNCFKQTFGATPSQYQEGSVDDRKQA